MFIFLRLWGILGFCFYAFVLCAQEPQYSDTLRLIPLEAIQVKSYRPQPEVIHFLPSVHGMFAVSGKKHEVLILQDMVANVVEKSARQIFGRVPGAFIYDMDGAGNQVNLATRGLDPHRSWEFNVRQNGVMTNTDIYGYPASHYSPPLEAMNRIELLRGTSSLQYGAGFGGMLQYHLRMPDTSRVLAYQSVQAVGSFKTLSSFHRLSGTKGKFSYQAFTQFRSADGYREASRTTAQSQYVGLTWKPSSKMTITGELSRSQYLFKMPGPLTDEQFKDNPRQATRERNYYEPDIYIPALHLDWQLNAKTSLSFVQSWITGKRNSVMFLGFANQEDRIDTLTGTYASRQVDIDNYNSHTSELRLRHTYLIGTRQQTFLAGIQGIHNLTRRRQLGKGTTGSDYDLRVEADGFGRDLNFLSRNLALYAENIWSFSSRWELSPALRMEMGSTGLRGKLVYSPNDDPVLNINRRFLLLGISSSFFINQYTTLYGGWSQAYRPVILAATIPANALERIDPNLKDAQGHNAELGIRGRAFQKRLTFDATLFQVLYKDRMGSVLETNDQGQTYLLRTNTGDSHTFGIESYLEFHILRQSLWDISIFSASAWMQGRYINGEIHQGGENISIKGNVLESAPEWTSRNGLNMRYRNFLFALQYNFVSCSYSDALNTKLPSPTGANGLVPEYGLWDLNVSIPVLPELQLRFSLNNLTNRSYFTKRPNGYPGAGIWPSDGRSVLVTVQMSL